MKSLENPLTVERFRTLILNRLGLQFDDAKLGFLGEVIRQRLENLGCSADDYLTVLEDKTTDGELRPLAKELTVPETYFFRNSEQFHAFTDVVLPSRMAAQTVSKTLNFLSAGCASGEEPYSIAIALREAVLDQSWTMSVRAVDINPAVLAKAKQAHYAPWAFRETPPELRRNWFRANGRDMVLDDSVRKAVTFEERNLAAEDPDLWRPGAYDAIFCRNMMMYFSPGHARALIARIARSLAPGGYLFLGHAETLRGLSDDFHLLHTHGTFYYERKDGPAHAFPGWERTAPKLFPTAPRYAALSEVALNEAWVDTIRDASARVEALVSGPAADARPHPRPSRAQGMPQDLAEAMGLLRNERFTEALAYVRELPREAELDPDVLLLEAMLLAHNGETAAAAEASRRLLVIDEMNAGAHYVLALCRESAGDCDGAVDHDKIAVYLDPAFAMPRLHMGLLARRTGDRDLARRELGQALTLLKHEDAARLLLFGGGFNRQALIALCGSALRDCGGQP